MRCAPDVLGAVGPINNAKKEITEAMAIIHAIRDYTIKRPMEYVLVDLCSGNALVPIIAAHLLPVRKAFAVDIRPRNGRYDRVKRFKYLNIDILDQAGDVEIIKHIHSDVANNDYVPLILTAVHPCSHLADKVVDIWNSFCFNVLAMMPCCVGDVSGPTLLDKKLSRYEMWAMKLYDNVDADKKNVKRDNGVISPANIVITSWRDNKYPLM